MRVREELGFLYASDCRGRKPFYPHVDGTIPKTLQISTTLPTPDEILGTPGITEKTIAGYYLTILKHEQGEELYYSVEVLLWLHFSPDIQIVSTMRRRLGTLLVPGNKVDTAVVTGFRVKIDF